MAKPGRDFIVEAIVKQLEQGISFDTCLKLSATKWNLTRSTFIRRWKEAGLQHTAAQQAIKAALANDHTVQALQAAKEAIMTAAERKEYLTRIVKGEVTTTLKKPFWNPVLEKMTMVPVENPADMMERLRAIAELNKMDGDYAPQKVAETTVAGKDIKRRIGYGKRDD